MIVLKLTNSDGDPFWINADQILTWYASPPGSTICIGPAGNPCRAICVAIEQ